VTDKPVAVGFGISRPEHAAQVLTIFQFPCRVGDAGRFSLLAQLQYFTLFIVVEFF